jgi:hypothetical protein
MPQALMCAMERVKYVESLTPGKVRRKHQIRQTYKLKKFPGAKAQTLLQLKCGVTVLRILKSLAKEKRRLINFYVSHEEKTLMQEKADEWAEGNLSEWVRYAAVFYKPDRGVRPKPPLSTRILMNVAVTHAEKARIEENVSAHLNKIDTLSDWVRLAALNHEPRGEDLVRI